MNPPTKFQKMRDNRAFFECQANRTDVWSRLFHGSTMPPNHGVVPTLRDDKAPAEPPKPPTMTVDGVEYVEAPESAGSRSQCEGCAFDNQEHLCREATHPSRRAFGADCADRPVIYLKAT